MRPEDQNGTRSGDVEHLLKIDEVAELLNVSPHTIRDYVLYRKIPFCKINGVVRFRLVEIQIWIDEQSIKPAVKQDAEGGNA